MPSGFVLVFILFAVAAAVIAWISYAAAAKRRQEFAQFAFANGFEYRADPGNLENTFSLLGLLNQGDRRTYRNLIYKWNSGAEWFVFDMDVITRSTDDEGHTSESSDPYQVVIASLPLVFERLSISPESFFTRTFMHDLQFESNEFNRKFRVQSDDKKFAYDMLHPVAMEYLMRNDGYLWETAGPFLMLAEHGRQRVIRIQELLTTVKEFAELIPQYVREDRGFANKPILSAARGTS